MREKEREKEKSKMKREVGLTEEELDLPKQVYEIEKEIGARLP